LLAKVPAPISTFSKPDQVRRLLYTLGSGRLLMPRTDAVDTSFGGLSSGPRVDAV
jgi:hypothetical protein